MKLEVNGHFCTYRNERIICESQNGKWVVKFSKVSGEYYWEIERGIYHLIFQSILLSKFPVHWLYLIVHFLLLR